jgi:hypothetical protein
MREGILRVALFLAIMQPIFSAAKADDFDELDSFNSPEVHAERVLGLGPCPTYEQVRDAYKQLALEWHPDKNREPSQREFFTQKMANITSAYQVLKEWLEINDAPEASKGKNGERSTSQADGPEGMADAQQEQTEDQAKEGAMPNAQREFDPYLLPPQGYEKALRAIESQMRCDIRKMPEFASVWQVYHHGSFEDRLNEFAEALRWVHRKYGTDPFEQKYAHVQQLLYSAMRLLPFYRTLKGISYPGNPDETAEFYAINLVGNFPRPDHLAQGQLVP